MSSEIILYFYLKTKITNFQAGYEYCLFELYFKPGMLLILCGPIIFISRIINDAIKKMLWSKLVVIITFDLNSFSISVFVIFCNQLRLFHLYLKIDKESSPRYSVVSGKPLLRL